MAVVTGDVIRRAAFVALIVLGSSCSTTQESVTPAVVEEVTSPTAPIVGEGSTSTSTTAALQSETSEAPAEIETTNAFNPQEPGFYLSSLLPIEIMLRTTMPLNVTQAEPGKIVMQALDTGDDFYGVGFFELDTMVLSDTNGGQIERIPASPDLGAFLDRVVGSDVVDQGNGEIGGLTGQWWRISWPDEGDCCWESLFRTAGWVNLWGNAPGYDQVIWVVDTPNGLLGVVVEAPTADFDAWSLEVDRAILAELTFGDPTAGSALRASSAAFGAFRVGQTEITVVDSSRPSDQVVADDGRVVVTAADERRLLLSAVYPAEVGGFGAAVVPGPHPLIVSAHALRDAGITLPAEHVLASHGYVVVTVRFPESSFPGISIAGIPNQPADVSFVLDEVLGGALGPELTDHIDSERIGLVGASAGATTAFGLSASDCCRDDRFSAVVAHAGSLYDFDTAERDIPSAAGTTAMLQVGSRSDLVSSDESLESLHEAWQTDAYLAFFQHDSHLGWLDPTSATFDDSVRVVVAFFDQHLLGTDVDLAAVAESGQFVDFLVN